MNLNPSVAEPLPGRTELHFVNGKLEEVNPQTVFELVRDIMDPEHPFTLEQLSVVSQDTIVIENIVPFGNEFDIGLPIKALTVFFRPTIPHCSMAAIIGLCIQVQLKRYVPDYWVKVHIVENTHVNYKALNKQLDDKDRVTAALENESLAEIINSCLSEIKGT